MDKISKNIVRLKEAFNKKHSLKEGVIDYIFGKILTNRLSNDKGFLQLAKQLDTDLQRIRDKVKELEAQGKPIPYPYKNILNIK